MKEHDIAKCPKIHTEICEFHLKTQEIFKKIIDFTALGYLKIIFGHLNFRDFTKI